IGRVNDVGTLVAHDLEGIVGDEGVGTRPIGGAAAVSEFYDRHTVEIRLSAGLTFDFTEHRALQPFLSDAQASTGMHVVAQCGRVTKYGFPDPFVTPASRHRRKRAGSGRVDAGVERRRV